MSDRAVVLAALAAACGAMAAIAVPRPFVWALVLGLVVALVRVPAAEAGRSRAVAVALALVVAVWTTSGASVALGALRNGPTGSFAGTVELVGDPVPGDFGARVDLRIEGRRVEASVERPLASRMLGHLAGDRLEVRGRYAARPEDAPWLDARHIAARFRIDEIGASRGTAAPFAVANAVRRVLARGALPLPEVRRSLYTGLVYGDDREQAALLADDFRAGGLGHLLAVSGQNVAFALAAAGPTTGAAQTAKTSSIFQRPARVRCAAIAASALGMPCTVRLTASGSACWGCGAAASPGSNDLEPDIEAESERRKGKPLEGIAVVFVHIGSGLGPFAQQPIRVGLLHSASWSVQHQNSPGFQSQARLFGIRINFDILPYAPRHCGIELVQAAGRKGQSPQHALFVRGRGRFCNAGSVGRVARQPSPLDQHSRSVAQTQGRDDHKTRAAAHRTVLQVDRVRRQPPATQVDVAPLLGLGRRR